MGELFKTMGKLTKVPRVRLTCISKYFVFVVEKNWHLYCSGGARVLAASPKAADPFTKPAASGYAGRHCSCAGGIAGMRRGGTCPPDLADHVTDGASIAHAFLLMVVEGRRWKTLLAHLQFVTTRTPLPSDAFAFGCQLWAHSLAVK